MMEPYKQDYHIHTKFSVDSEANMEAACEAALACGISEIAFTDHLDFGPEDSSGYFRATEYLAAIERCRAQYDGRLVVRAGVEVGEPHLFAAEACAVVAHADFDIVLGSAHYADGMQAAWMEDFFEQPLRQAYESYFRQVVDLSAEGEFDVLGHLDLVKRDAHKFGRPYDGPEPYADMIRTALRSLVERGKGIEVNTSPLRHGQPEPCPSPQILRWYRELGGEILTLGSDAHSPAAVGAHIDLAMEIARGTGFEHLATFRKRHIDWIRI
ncbi:MAG: histidinol-phosphatase HisJ family protein [Anaerolineae bacterium]|jgi:histidinol-phosphatase (PHP family)